MISLRSAAVVPGCTPQGRDIAGQGANPVPLLRADPEGLFSEEPIIFVFEFALVLQRLLPAPFQRAGHQAVFRLDGLILPFGALRLVARPLQLLLPMAMEALALLLDVLDRSHAQFQGCGLQGPEDLPGHEVIDRRRLQPVAGLLRALAQVSLATVMRVRLRRVGGLQVAAAGATNEQPHKQRGPLARCPRRTGERAILLQPSPIGQVALPCDVGREAIPYKHLPLRARVRLLTGVAGPRGRPLGIAREMPIGVDPCVDRVVQDPIQRRQRRSSPLQLAAPRPVLNPHAHADVVPHQVVEQAEDGAQLVELVEDQPHDVAGLFIRVQGDLAGRQLDVPDRHLMEQLAAHGLVELSGVPIATEKKTTIFTRSAGPWMKN